MSSSISVGSARPDAIPGWSSLGVLPAVRPGASGHSWDRSPYRVSLVEVVERFGATLERRGLLRGLLEFRVRLTAAGLVEGFQWLDGSFVEDVERERGRPPGDVDVVTFVPLGGEVEQRRLYAEHGELFEHGGVKRAWGLDHYFVGLGEPLDGARTREIAYWYSMWSHRRGDERWKGFVQVALDSEQDRAALDLLARLEAGAGADDVEVCHEP